MKENVLNLVEEIDIEVQEAQRVPNKMDAKRSTPRHIIIKMPKVKDKEGIFFLRILIFLEGKGGRKRGKETSVCSCLLHTSFW